MILLYGMSISCKWYSIRMSVFNTNVNIHQQKQKVTIQIITYQFGLQPIERIVHFHPERHSVST